MRGSNFPGFEWRKENYQKLVFLSLGVYRNNLLVPCDTNIFILESNEELADEGCFEGIERVVEGTNFSISNSFRAPGRFTELQMNAINSSLNL